jgi:hypothetical protein
VHRVAEATGVDPAAIEPSETPKAKLCPFAGVDQQASGDDRVHRVRQPVMSAIEDRALRGHGARTLAPAKKLFVFKHRQSGFSQGFFVQSRSIAFGSGVDRN